VLTLWTFELAVTLVGWVTSWFPSDLVIPYPSNGLNLLIPVPIATSGMIALLNSWWGIALLLFAALAVGRFLTWLYRLIPANG